MGMSDIKVGSSYKARGIEGTLQGQAKESGSVQIAVDALLLEIDKEKGGMRVPLIMTAKNKDGGLNEYTRDRLLTMGWDGKAKRFAGYWSREFEVYAKERTYEKDGATHTSIEFEVRTENMQFKFRDAMPEDELDALSEMMSLGEQAEAKGGYSQSWDDTAPKRKLDV